MKNRVIKKVSQTTADKLINLFGPELAEEIIDGIENLGMRIDEKALDSGMLKYLEDEDADPEIKKLAADAILKGILWDQRN